MNIDDKGRPIRVRDSVIDPETGIITHLPSAARVLMRLSDPYINSFFKEAAEKENNSELKKLYRDFNKIRAGLAKYIRENNMK